VEVKILQKNKNNRLIEASILVILLILTSCVNITTATSSISNYEEAADYVADQLSIDKDEYLIYVWGLIDEGEEVFGTEEHIITTPEKGYIVYIDLYPTANLFHPVQYVFLSENKEKLILKDAMSPPLNNENYQNIETEIGEKILSAQNRRATISEGRNPNTMRGSSDSRYAVLMNGGYNAGNNHVRYWNDLSNIYITLVDVYGYPDENIIVLCSDGLDPAVDQSNGQNSDPDLDGDGDDDIMYSCVLSNIDMVFGELADNLTTGSELFVFVTDHGNTNGGYDTYFNLWNMEELTDAHFADLLDELPECEIVCTFEPCFSGGFIGDVAVPPGPRVASSACRHDEYSWAMPPNYEYDEYVFYWTAAVNGEDAYGDPHDADYNDDGVITMDEAFIYAEYMDTANEEPQYGDYPEGVGENITLWPGSDPPETPTVPEGPDEWIQNVETTFSSTATEPDGEDIYYMFNWGDGNFSDWVGPYASGETGEASHSWAELGEYEIRAVVKDINGVQSNWSDPAFLTIVENQKPTAPEITGNKIGFAGKEYEFTFVSTDPDGHDLYYMVNWDDGQKTDWLGPYSSGEQIKISHTWNKKDTYWIKAWAKDSMGDESNQGNFQINILRDKAKTSSAYINQIFLEILRTLFNRFPILSQLLR
jgi:hypothetical protein